MLRKLFWVFVFGVTFPIFTFAQYPPPGGGQDVTLTVNKNGAGSGTVRDNSVPLKIDCGSTCGASYGMGSFVILNAVADAGSIFAGWSGGSCWGTDPCTVFLTGNITITATFNLTGGGDEQYALNVSKTGGGSGVVTSSPSGINCGATCRANFGNDTSVTLSASPASGSIFVGWSGDCGGSSCSLMMNGDKNVTARFDLTSGGGGAPPLQLTVSLKGGGAGLVASDPSGIRCEEGVCVASFPLYSLVTLTANPKTNSVFDGWGGDCANRQSDPICALTMTAPKVVDAFFRSTASDDNGYYDDYFSQSPYDFYIEEIKKKKTRTPISVFQQIYNFIGKKKYARESIKKANWKTFPNGLRGSFPGGNVLTDLFSGFTQYSFFGGKRSLKGQLTYYLTGAAQNAEFIDVSNNRIAVAETITLEENPILLNLFFNGPPDQPTLFGKIIDPNQEERFFITRPGGAEGGVSIHPLVTKIPLKLPAAQLSPPPDLMEKFFQSLDESNLLSWFLPKKALAAALSFSQIPRLRGILITLRNDESSIRQTIDDFNRGRELLSQVLIDNGFADVAEIYNKGEIATQDLLYEMLAAGLIDSENPDPIFDSLFQLGDSDIAELKEMSRSNQQKITDLKTRLGNYGILNKPEDWFAADGDEALKLSQDLGISKNLAHLLLVKELPRPFVAAIIRSVSDGGGVIVARCAGEILSCKAMQLPKSLDDRIREWAAKYDNLLTDYQFLIQQVESRMFSAYEGV